MVYMALKLKRKVVTELLTTYLPTILLLLITFITIFFDKDLFADAIAVNLTIMLVMTPIFTSKIEELPPTSDMKMIDIWLIFCVVVPFLEVILRTAIECVNCSCHICQPRDADRDKEEDKDKDKDKAGEEDEETRTGPLPEPSLAVWATTVIVNYQDFPIFSSNFKILEILKFFHQFIKENHQFIKFIKFHKIFFLDLVPPSKKLQMQTQIQTKTEKMTRIFFIER